MSIRVAVADDQPLLVSAFAALLDAQPDLRVIGTATDGREALALCRQQPVDVVVLDVRMPVCDGLATVRALSAAGERPYALMLTTFDDDEAVLAAVRAGARGFLLKDTAPDQLIEAVRTVHAGGAVFGPTPARQLSEGYRTADVGTAARPRPPAVLAGLTGREREVLATVAAGLSNAEIAGRLVIAETTVKTHVSSLLAKLGCRDRVALVVLAHAAGVAPQS